MYARSFRIRVSSGNSKLASHGQTISANYRFAIKKENKLTKSNALPGKFHIHQKFLMGFRSGVCFCYCFCCLMFDVFALEIWVPSTNKPKYCSSLEDCGIFYLPFIHFLSLNVGSKSKKFLPCSKSTQQTR